MSFTAFTAASGAGRLPRRRRGAAAALAAAALLSVTVAPAVAAAPTQSTADEGLFGAGDPAYDGVWRQSVALLAQAAAGYAPADPAVDWLLGQQCADGSFLSYRADTGTPCRDVTAADTNATALAVQALAQLDDPRGADAVDSALTWLRGVQNADGGWSFNPGGPSDANSTSLVLGAIAATGTHPAEVRRDGATPYDALAGLQLGCDAEEDLRGAFAWQPDPESGQLYPNDAATVDAVLAAYGSGLLVDPDEPPGATTSVTAPDCDATGEEEQQEEESGETATPDEGATEEAGQETVSPAGPAGAAYLAGVLEENDQHLVTLTDDGEEQPDFGSTADAVIALAASGDETAAQGPFGWLQDNLASWEGYEDNPAAIGTLVLAAHATGASPEDFGGTDLVAALNALGPAPDEAPAAGEATGDEASDDDGGAMGPLLWITGVGIIAGIGIGFVLRMRRAGNAAAPEAGEPAAAEPKATEE